MPERSFGRMVRYRRTKLGLSQAKLGELVGRSTATIRSWERDKRRPNDEKVLSALAAILGVSERQLFDKADVDRPAVETSPTVEQALASLSTVEETTVVPDETEVGDSHPGRPSAGEPISVPQTPPPIPVVVGAVQRHIGAIAEDEGELFSEMDFPAYVAPPEPYVQTPLTPTLADVSYVEDPSQRQMYRVRTLATLVGFVGLVVAFVWALGEGVGALGVWWDDFFGNLRL
ncbi:MAG TPA: helix-turn-helix domain-containing protein [Acidimicrobiia bacterium]|nr:helix-turn-helix domain-containing protein [Acidimicrobiia bacterium]